jgi:hypothetical protein
VENMNHLPYEKHKIVELKRLTIFCFGNTEDVIVLSFICHFCDSKDKLMISKSNTAASFASFFCQRFCSCILCWAVLYCCA